MRYPPITGDLSLDLGDGNVVTALTDIDLATQWVKHVLGDEWTRMGATERAREVGEALAELRRSAFEASTADSLN